MYSSSLKVIEKYPLLFECFSNFFVNTIFNDYKPTDPVDGCKIWKENIERCYHCFGYRWDAEYNDW